MGVRGLNTFIKQNPNLTNDYQLGGTKVIIDACNLVGALYRLSQHDPAHDRFGGDLVQYGHCIKVFFDALKRCDIEPILVFDGAQTSAQERCKFREKLRRAVERFKITWEISNGRIAAGPGSSILPAAATQVFRSIIVDRELQIIQCMFEADLEIARLSHVHECPVVSNDSDFFLMDLPHGLIQIDLMDYKGIKKSPDSAGFYMPCCIFSQDHFVREFPNLDKRNLPLVGILAGNDFIEGHVFQQICEQLPLRRVCEDLAMDIEHFRRKHSYHHQKIYKILYFLSGRTLNECINDICDRVPRKDRDNMKDLIRSNLMVYDIPVDDTFMKEIIGLYRKGFYATNSKLIKDKDELDLRFEENMLMITKWLKNMMEHSVMTYRCLEVAHRNQLFINSQPEDPGLPCAHLVQRRQLGVLMRLLRSCKFSDNKPIVMHHRINNYFGKSTVSPVNELENYGRLDYLVFDVPNLCAQDKQGILMATFNCKWVDYVERLVALQDWLKPAHAEEFLIIKILLDNIDLDSGGPKLWDSFRRATMLCMLFYLYNTKSDNIFGEKLEEIGRAIFMDQLVAYINENSSTKDSLESGSSRGKRYNSRIVHQIVQLQVSIASFNQLNAFFGDLTTRIRPENWLNSFLIYNLTSALKHKLLRPTGTLEILVAD